MNYPTLEQALFLHDDIVKDTGGSKGVRDFGLLHSAIERPKASFAGKDLYPTIFLKAAALLHSLTLNHPFIDGNKRTAVALTVRLFLINKRPLKAKQKKLIKLSLEIENKKKNIEQIADWLKKHA